MVETRRSGRCCWASALAVADPRRTFSTRRESPRPVHRRGWQTVGDFPRLDLRESTRSPPCRRRAPRSPRGPLPSPRAAASPAGRLLGRGRGAGGLGPVSFPLFQGTRGTPVDGSLRYCAWRSFSVRWKTRSMRRTGQQPFDGRMSLHGLSRSITVEGIKRRFNRRLSVSAGADKRENAARASYPETTSKRREIRRFSAVSRSRNTSSALVRRVSDRRTAKVLIRLYRSGSVWMRILSA